MQAKTDDIAVRVENLHKSFKLPHERYTSLKHVVLNFYKRKTYEKQHVLKGVSFEIKKGEFFGIVGRNGSGKSTLLKLLAGIYTPDKGHVAVNGKLTPFIELGVGFNPELTGRENVFLNGALLGFSRKEMAAMYDEIVEFAELGRFMDQKLKNYSSGMQVRLAFAIAIQARSDILLLDEVLAVGDEAFQKKCFEYFAQLQRENRTVILVSHNMDSVQRFCARAMFLDKGEIQFIGSTAEATNSYQDANREPLLRRQPRQGSRQQGKLKPNEEDIDIDIQTMNQKGEKVNNFLPEDKIVFQLKVTAKKTVKDAFVGLTIQNPEGKPIYWITTEAEERQVERFRAGKPVYLRLELQNVFGENSYSVDLSVKSNDRSKEYLMKRGAIFFNVLGRGRNGWMLHPEYKMTVTARGR